MVQLLSQLLPPGEISQTSGRGSEASGRPSAGLTYDDGRGAVRISVTVGRVSLPVPPNTRDCLDRARYPYDRCTRSELPHGATLLANRGYVNAVDPKGARRWLAVLTTRDGGQIGVTESSAATGSPVRPNLALPMSRLVSIVTSKLWSPVLDAVPIPPKSSPPVTAVLSGSEILSAMQQLLPRGWQAADEYGAEKGYASMTVNDGQGKCLLTVTVQRWSPGSPEIAQLFAGAAVRPDGTRVLTRRLPVAGGAGGTFQWDADVLVTDGLRIVVSEVNAPAFGLPATRAVPLLSIPQLRAIALSSRWKARY